MSLHIEWDDSKAEVELYAKGYEFEGYDEPVTHDFGLLIGGAGGGAFMVEGTREQLLAFLDRARRAVEGPAEEPEVEDEDDDDERLYETVRFYAESHPQEVVDTDLTLAEAQAACEDPETSSRTATSDEAVERTRTYGAWFVGYREQ